VFERLDVTGRWPSVLAALGMEERFLRNRHGPCPLCGGKDRYRFDDKDGKGTWYCNGCGSGNGFELVRRFKGVSSFNDALDLVRAVMGHAAATPPRKSKERQERGAEDEHKALRKMWRGSKPVEKGDPVDLYLRGRGLALDNYPTALRTHPSLPYCEDRKVVACYPAMLALVSGAGGEPVSIHRTYLHNGKKAPVPSPKKLVSRTGTGIAVRLWEQTDTLCLTEGIETAIAVHLLTGKPVWASTSAGQLEAFTSPVGELVVYADNDEKFAGQSAAFALAKRMAAQGVRVRVEIPPRPGTDWADLWSISQQGE
jgi:putative DNA primase/helicase